MLTQLNFMKKYDRSRMLDYLLQNYTVVKANVIESDGRSVALPLLGADDVVTGFGLADETQPDGSAYYDGTVAGFVQTGLTSLDINNKTFIVAYRPSAAALAGAGPYVLRWLSVAGNELRIYSTSAGSFNVLYGGDGVNQAIVGDPNDWTAGEDYLLVLAIPGAGEVLRFYSNGAELGNLTITNATVSSAVNANAAGVGAVTNAGTNYCNGLISALTIVDGVLDANEVAEVYRAWSR